MSYMTAGKLQAFEALHRPYWKYQTCVFEECPYSPVKLSTLRCQPVMSREG